MTFVEQIYAAERKHAIEASEAMRLFKAMCGGRLPPRVPGMDTFLRLAWRIECGRTPEQAAANEYLYRWNLALRSPVFGTPHTLGM